MENGKKRVNSFPANYVTLRQLHEQRLIEEQKKREEEEEEETLPTREVLENKEREPNARRDGQYRWTQKRGEIATTGQNIEVEGKKKAGRGIDRNRRKGLVTGYGRYPREGEDSSQADVHGSDQPDRLEREREKRDGEIASKSPNPEAGRKSNGGDGKEGPPDGEQSLKNNSKPKAKKKKKKMKKKEMEVEENTEKGSEVIAAKPSPMEEEKTRVKKTITLTSKPENESEDIVVKSSPTNHPGVKREIRSGFRQKKDYRPIQPLKPVRVSEAESGSLVEMAQELVDLEIADGDGSMAGRYAGKEEDNSRSVAGVTSRGGRSSRRRSSSTSSGRGMVWVKKLEVS